MVEDLECIFTESHNSIFLQVSFDIRCDYVCGSHVYEQLVLRFSSHGYRRGDLQIHRIPRVSKL